MKSRFVIQKLEYPHQNRIIEVENLQPKKINKEEIHWIEMMPWQ